MSTSTLQMTGISPDNYGIARTNYDKKIMALYKFEENPTPLNLYTLKEGNKNNNSQQRSEYDIMMLKRFKPSF